MDRHDHIVMRVPTAPARTPHRERKEDAEVLGAWLWPSSDTPEYSGDAVENVPAIEVSLLPETRRLLRDFPVAGLERPYLQHLEQRIVRHPRDLLSHVRRLFLACALRDRDSIMGALVDLFLVLGPRGQDLRARLLGLAEDQLTPQQCGYFVAHLKEGLDATEALPDIPQSRLSKSVSGTTRIVVRSKDESRSVDEPVSLARESITNGHCDIALAMLEGALESDPGDKDVCEELLQLYRSRNLASRFFKTYTALLGRQLACPERWAQLAADFRSGVPHAD